MDPSNFKSGLSLGRYLKSAELVVKKVGN